jgi:hypothetical protein
VSNSLDAFQKEIRKIENFRNTSDKLYKARQISDRHIEYVYEMCFLSAFIGLEAFFETAFINMMCDRHRPSGVRFRRKIEFKSPSVAREALYDGKSYLDLFPINHMERKATIFFTSGLPFTSLSKADKKDIEFYLAIRNLIAHKSIGAEKQFQRILVTRATLPPSQHTAARFLRSFFSASTTRFEQEVGTMLALAIRMWG